MAAPGPDLRVLGRVAPTREQRADVLFGWPILEELARLGLGGAALAVRERDVIAARADEPLAAVIERAGSLCRRRGWTLLADGAIDGSTVECLARARGGCLALRGVAGTHAAVIDAADSARVALVRVRCSASSAPERPTAAGPPG